VPAAGFRSQQAVVVCAGLADLPDVVTLVLDDFHHIHDREVLESFSYLLEHQPPQIRMVLATRADPALRLNRLRVNDALTDIRAEDLAFTEQEAAQLLDLNHLQLTGRPLEMLLNRTQGWAAGLRLAVMCLDQKDADAGLSWFTGTERLVGEYLLEEVVERLPPGERQFLLMTSVVDRICAGWRTS